MEDFTNPKVLDHFKNPRNAKPLDDYDLVGEYGSPLCGDSLRVWLKLDSSKQTIQNAGFKAFGCISAVASSSALMTLLPGLSLDQASKLTAQDVADVLGGLPEKNMHCPEIPLNAMRKALASTGLDAPVHPISMNMSGIHMSRPSSSHSEMLSKAVGLWIKVLKPALENAGVHAKFAGLFGTTVNLEMHGDLSEIAGMSPDKWAELKFKDEVDQAIIVKRT